MNRGFPFLLNIGFGHFVPVPTIIGIFNAENSDVIMENVHINETIFIADNRPVKSYIYCIGGYLVGSPIEAKTLKKRYEEFQNIMNGQSDDETLYIRKK